MNLFHELSMRLWRRHRAAASSCLIGGGLVVALSASGQSLSSDWGAFNTGGDVSRSGPVTLVASIGNLEAVRVEGGGYVLLGGFFGDLLDTPPSDLPVLSIAHAHGALTISWTSHPARLVLQFTDSLSPPAWKDAPSESANPVELSVASSTRFYRLRSADSSTERP